MGNGPQFRNDLLEQHKLTDEKLKAILDGNGQEITERAKEIGKLLACQGVSRSQIRKVFDVVKKIEMKITSISDEENIKKLIGEAYFVEAKLSYLIGRTNDKYNQKEPQKSKYPKTCLEILRRDWLKLIENSTNEPHNFLNISKYIEGILAYHRYYGGGN